jgi:hypothetical protein
MIGLLNRRLIPNVTCRVNGKMKKAGEIDHRAFLS